MDIWEKKPSMKILTVGCRRLDTLSPCILGRPLQLPNAILPRWKMESPGYSHKQIFCLLRTFSIDITSECYRSRKVALQVSPGVPGGTWEAKFRSRNAYWIRPRNVQIVSRKERIISSQIWVHCFVLNSRQTADNLPIKLSKWQYLEVRALQSLGLGPSSSSVTSAVRTCACGRVALI